MNPYVVAAWDLGILHASANTFVAEASESRNWILRGEAVRAGLAEPQVWDGVASESALGAIACWLAVLARIGPPLVALADGILEAVGWYRQAQEAAAVALRIAAANGVAVSGTGEVTPGPQADTTGMAPEQAVLAVDRGAAAGAVLAELERARLATARADALVESDIGQFLVLGIPGLDADSHFPDLAASLRVPMLSLLDLLAGRTDRGVPVPLGVDPATVARWWAGLTFDQQLQLIAESPELIGNLDGVSAWARDLANRALLADLLQADPDSAFATAVATALASAEASGLIAQLYVFDPQRELAAVAAGDLDTALNVAVLVPGMGTSVAEDMVRYTDNAVRVWAASQAAAAGASVAVLAWIGYDTPDGVQAMSESLAVQGAPALASTVAGISSRPGGAPRVTVVAHSYGTVTTGYAGAWRDEFTVDSVVLLGSPGMDVPMSIFDVPASEVYVGEAFFDVVTMSDWYPIDPADFDDDGGTCIDASNINLLGNGHTHYYDMTSQALWNVGAIVVGRRDRLARC